MRVWKSDNSPVGCGSQKSRAHPVDHLSGPHALLPDRQYIIDTGLDEWKEANPRDVNQLGSPVYRFFLEASIFWSDETLQYTLLLLLCSFLGRFVNFLFNSVNTIDLCMNIPILAKVIESITASANQVVGTVILGFCMQYMFVGAGFVMFSEGYGFADMDTSVCATLVDCLVAHWDYGFRSAPVWNSADLDYVTFLFDYSYNLIIILIMAAIISGIIIDAFAELKEEQQSKEEAQTNNCFICCLNKAELERSKINFQQHILLDHYMWAYARFLLYLDETDPSNLTGPESYIQKMRKDNNTAFFPIGRCIDMESSEAGEDHLERAVKVKDMEEFRKPLGDIRDNANVVKTSEMQFKAELKDLRETLILSAGKVVEMTTKMASEEDGDKKKKKKKKGG